MNKNLTFGLPSGSRWVSSSDFQESGLWLLLDFLGPALVPASYY